MKCHCSQNRERLALLVGQDAVGELPEEIRRKLANCPQCREHYQQLCASQQLLQQVHDEEAASLPCSLWPALMRRLPEARPACSYRLETFKQQFVPVFSMAAACLAVLLVFSETRTTNSRIYQTAINRGVSPFSIPFTPVGNSLSPSLEDERFLPSPDFQGRVSQSSMMPQEPRSAVRPQLTEENLFDILRADFERDLHHLQK